MKSSLVENIFAHALNISPQICMAMLMPDNQANTIWALAHNSLRVSQGQAYFAKSMPPARPERIDQNHIY
jgi:hypothetical protein